MNIIKQIKYKLGYLRTNSLCVEEKNALINDIRELYSTLSQEQKYKLENWLNGRYRKFFNYLAVYQDNHHKRVDFSYDIFRWGIPGAIAQDVEYSIFLLKPIMNNKTNLSTATLSYAYYAYGTAMFHLYREGKNNNIDDAYYYHQSIETLSISANAESNYLRQRSCYFLAETYTLKGNFSQSIDFYFQAISNQNALASQSELIWHIITNRKAIGIFDKISNIFSKEHTLNLDFWKLLLEHIKIGEVQKNISHIVAFLENKTYIKKEIHSAEKVINFCKKLTNYLKYLVEDEICELQQLENMYHDNDYTKKAKSQILFKMGKLIADVERDIPKAILFMSESIDLYADRNRFKFISDLFLVYHKEEIQNILKQERYKFKNSVLQKYIVEKSMGKSAWKRFVQVGFINGEFDEEIEFLEYLADKDISFDLKKLINTRLGYLYFKGHSGIRIHDFNQPDYKKAKSLFMNLKEYSIVKKYLEHPILSIYNDMEIRKDNNQYIFFENEDSYKLLIVFSCAFSYSHYAQLRTFYNNNKVNVLFINNPKLNWYSDEEWYRVTDIIDNFALKKFNQKNITTYFGSMGGYAALKVGLTYHFKTIVFNPQIDMNIWLKHRPVLKPRMRNVKELVNLQKMPINMYEKTPIYYMTSSSIEDVEAFSIFIDKIQNCSNGLFLLEKIPANIHAGIFGRVYGDSQQDVLLQIDELLNEYNESRYTPPYIINKTQADDFWQYIDDVMEIKIVIKIVNGTIFYGVVNSYLDVNHLFSELPNLQDRKL
jgi:hypothetical protein